MVGGTEGLVTASAMELEQIHTTLVREDNPHARIALRLHYTLALWLHMHPRSDTHTILTTILATILPTILTTILTTILSTTILTTVLTPILTTVLTTTHSSHRPCFRRTIISSACSKAPT
jgi:hypothetical protein